jgi:hypothetical protein
MKKLPSIVFSVGVLALVLATVFFMASRSAADPDLWGHITFGNDFLRTGHISQTDTFSYLTQGNSWIDHEWLTEVIFAKVFALAGASGLVFLKLFMAALIAGVGFLYFRRQGLSALRAGLLVILMFVPLFVWLQTIRAQIFTYLLFFVVLLTVHSYEMGEKRLPLWFLPLVFILWANLHGGFVSGLALFYVWAGITLLEQSLKQRSFAWLKTSKGLQLVFAMCFCLPATLLTPYGVALWKLLLETAVGPRPEIVEWVGLDLRSTYGACYLWMVGTAGCGFFLERRGVTFARVAILVLTAVAPLMAYRHLPLFALSWGVLTADVFAAFFRKIGERRPWEPALYFFGVSYLIAAICLFEMGSKRVTCIAFGGRTGLEFPVEAVQFMKENQIEGNLAVYFDWGEYVLFHLSPRIRVSIDGRRETAYSTNVYMENLRLAYGEGDWEALLRREQTQFALFPVSSKAYSLIRTRPGWKLWHEDSLSALFARNDRVPPRTLATRGSQSNGCFP